jgi:hypothetical protein
VFSFTVFTALLFSGFLCTGVPNCHRPHLVQLSTDCLQTPLCSNWLPGWRSSHTSLLLFHLSSQDSSGVRARVTLWLAVYRLSVHLGDKPLEIHDTQFFSQLNTCGHSPSVTSSLTRGWVCRLQLLLVLASAVILRSESCGTHDRILLSQIRGPSNLSWAEWVTLRMTAYRHSVRLGARPLETHDQRFFSTELLP